MNIWLVKVFDGEGIITEMYLVKDAESKDEAIRKLDYGLLAEDWYLKLERVVFNEDVAKVV